MTGPVKKYPRHRASRRPMTIAIVAFVAAAALIALILTVNFGFNGDHASTQTPSSASPTSTVSPTVSPSPTGIDPANLDEPTPASPSASATQTPKPLNTGNGSGCDVGNKFQTQLQNETVDRNVGAEFKGTVCLKKGKTIWAFNFDTNRSLYVLASGKTDRPAPVITRSGVWSWNDFEVDANTIVNFVLADTTCSNWIKGQDPNADFGNRIVLNNIQQHGCQVIASKEITTVN